MATSKLGAALKRKFPGPRGVKRVASILGIDESLISAAAPEPAAGNGEGNSKANVKELRHALSAAVEKAGLSNQIHSDVAAEILELLDRHAPYALDEDDPLASFKKLLRANGLSEDDVSKACDIASRARSARDQMPANGLEGGAGGARSGKKVDRPQTRIAADELRLQRRFPGFELIVGEVADRHAMDAKPLGPSHAAVARFHEKYPGAAEIRR